MRKTCERPILYLIFCSLFRLDKVTWAEATEEECEKMTKCRVSMNKLVIPTVEGFRLEYLSMKLPKSPVTTPVLPIDVSDSASDTSSGSSGDYSDLSEEEPGSPSPSSDSSRTIGYTPPQSDFEAHSPGSTQDMAIVIDDEEEDSPFCPPGQNLDVIDLTKDTDMELSSQPESLIQPESSNFEEGRKRKANDIDTYHHPLIEFEATGKLLFKFILFNPRALLCVVVHQI